MQPVTERHGGGSCGKPSCGGKCQSRLPELTAEERDRYARQIGPGAFSELGQRRLKAATALVTRVGGVGGPAALALVTAGVGRVIVAHAGDLDSPDLNRQILGSEAGLGTARAAQFAARLRGMNRFVAVEEIDHEPGDEEAAELARRADVVLSCAADFAQRLRLNRAARGAGKPFIDAAQWGLTGSVVVCAGTDGPCLACAYPNEPPFEPFFPVAGAIAGAVGNLAALEALKILTRTGIPRHGKMLVVDGHAGETRTIALTQRPGCAVCGG